MFEWKPLIQRLGENFASRAAEYDQNDRFVIPIGEELKREKLVLRDGSRQNCVARGFRTPKCVVAIRN